MQGEQTLSLTKVVEIERFAHGISSAEASRFCIPNTAASTRTGSTVTLLST